MADQRRLDDIRHYARSPFSRYRLCASCAVLALGLVIVSIAWLLALSEGPVKEITSAQVDANVLNWVMLESFTGSAGNAPEKTSLEFTIPSRRWRFLWRHRATGEGGSLSIQVRRPDGTLVCRCADTAAAYDSKIHYFAGQPGRFTLEVEVRNSSWTVIAWKGEEPSLNVGQGVARLWAESKVWGGLLGMAIIFLSSLRVRGWALGGWRAAHDGPAKSRRALYLERVTSWTAAWLVCVLGLAAFTALFGVLNQELPRMLILLVGGTIYLAILCLLYILPRDQR